MKYIFLIFAVFSQIACLANTLHVLNMNLLPKDESSEEVLDLNGDNCASITVKADVEDLQFVGNIVKCIRKSGAYKIYLTGGSRKLTLYHSSILPTDIVFKNFGVKYVKPSDNYILTCKVVEDANERVNLFDNSPEMVYARYDYASRLADGALDKSVEMANEIHTFDFNRADYGERLLSEQEEYSIAQKYLPQFSREVANAISAARLGYAPALEVLRKAYAGKYTLPFLEPYLKELKQDSENKLSRMMVNYITDVSTYNPLIKLYKQSISEACEKILLPEEDNLDAILPLDESTLKLVELILEYNDIAYRLENYRIECKIREPHLILHAIFINKPYRVLHADDYAASSRYGGIESPARIRLMMLWKEIKEYCNQYK